MNADFFLIQKIKKGDETAIDELVHKYYHSILQYCRYHTFDQDMAEDLTQETFIKFFRNVSDYRHMGKVINYLYVIARNLCIDYGRKQHEILIDDIGILENKKENSGLNNIEIKIDMEQALRKLPDEMREVITLYYFQGFSMVEIAKILDIGVSLTKYRIKRAKEQLKEILRKEY